MCSTYYEYVYNNTSTCTCTIQLELDNVYTIYTFYTLREWSTYAYCSPIVNVSYRATISKTLYYIVNRSPDRNFAHTIPYRTKRSNANYSTFPCEIQFDCVWMWIIYIIPLPIAPSSHHFMRARTRNLRRHEYPRLEKTISRHTLRYELTALR